MNARASIAGSLSQPTCPPKSSKCRARPTFDWTGAVQLDPLPLRRLHAVEDLLRHARGVVFEVPRLHRIRMEVELRRVEHEPLRDARPVVRHEVLHVLRVAFLD